MLLFIERLSLRQFWALILVLYFSATLPLLTSWPVLWPDEVHFADIARTFAEHGYLGTTLIKGMENHVYWQPPMYFVILAGVIKVVGFDIVALRIFSILVGLAIIILTYQIAVRASNNLVVPRLTLLFLAVNPLFVNYIKLVRMDGVCMLWNLLAIYSALSTRERVWIPATFVALACFTHPFGLIGACAFFLFALFAEEGKKRWQNILVLISVLAIGFGLWGAYIAEDIPSFLFQMNFQFARKASNTVVAPVQFIKSFWRMPLWLPATLIALGLLWSEFFSNRSRAIRLLSLHLLISVMIVALTFELFYHLYVLPYASMAIALMLWLWSRSGRRHFVSTAVSLLLIANSLVYFGYVNVLVHVRLKQKAEYKTIVQDVEQHLAPNSTLMLSGLPSLFWGLHGEGKSFRFVEPVFLNEHLKGEALENLNYLIITRAHYPERDSADLEDKLNICSPVLQRLGKGLRHIASIGVKERYAYSSEIFEVVSLSGHSP
jgi:4-amino-4-deoxy-L-arabinose transferase-like glycosyltransferase